MIGSTQTKSVNEKFVVIKMKSIDFYRAENLAEVYVMDDKTSDINKYSWSKCKSITFTRDKPYVLKIKQHSADKSTRSISIPMRSENAPDNIPRIKRLANALVP